MKKKILALCVHPNLSGNFSKGDIKQSFANNIILTELDNYEEITIHPIGDIYPDHKIDVDREQALLTSHDSILMIGPIYWYSLPAIAKQWIDDVLLYGWAYGSKGKALNNKEIQLVLTSGSRLEEYTAEEIGSTINELFVFYRRSFEYCNMIWKPIRFIGNINSTAISANKEELTEKLKEFANDLILSN